MKRFLKIFTVITLMMIALTGCVDINYEVTLNRDGTADISYIYGFEKQMLEEMGTTAEEMTQDMKENAQTSDFKVEIFSNDELEGFKATKHIEDLSQISLEEIFGEENVKDSDENQIKIEKKGRKTLYSQKANLDLSAMDEMAASMVKMKYTIKLPTKVGNNNAMEVSKDGKTLTWNLKPGEVNKIEFEATQSGIIDAKILIISLAAIIIVIIIVILIAKKQKKKNKEMDNGIDTEISE